MASTRKRARKNSIENITSIDNFREWTVEELHTYVSSKGFNEEANCLKRGKISGHVLLDLTDNHLKELGIRLLGKRLQLYQLFKELQNHKKPVNYKIFNDPIHGHIELHPLCISIIDTIQFQRLRQIKQLGCCYYVFPGASHNRFEHSIGVCHLAGKLARTLQEKQPELNITALDILCVEIAGLCHDLGHGPFSHMFDGIFIPLVNPGSKWSHEDASVQMFDYLIEDNNLRQKCTDYGLTDIDILFIKEQIAGPQNTEDSTKICCGRSENKCFLYEIVANKRNGIDVDKWDYFARDCHMLGISNSFDYNRFMKFAKVMKVEEEYQICTRDKEVGNLYDMFHTRNSLHRRAYQHKVNKIIETMIVEAFVLANDHFMIAGKNGKKLKMSEAINDMVAYCQMTDNILYQLLSSSDPKLAESRSIITNVLNRNLYKCIGQTQPEEDDYPLPRKHIPQMKDEIVRAQLSGKPQLKSSDLVVHVVDLNYGKGSENPIDFVRFYSKSNPQQATMVRKSDVSQMLPEKFAEQQIRVYCKLRDPESLEKATACFVKWCEDKQLKPKCGNVDPELTPFKPGPRPQGELHGQCRTRLSL